MSVRCLAEDEKPDNYIDRSSVMHHASLLQHTHYGSSICQCRFMKTSGKIVDKMGSNLGQIAAVAKQAADKVGEQIWGKGRDQ